MYGRWNSGMKIKIAQRLLSEVIDSLAYRDDIQMALRAYGHQSPVISREQRDCEDSKLEVPFGPNNTKAILKKLEQARFLVGEDRSHRSFDVGGLQPPGFDEQLDGTGVGHFGQAYKGLRLGPTPLQNQVQRILAKIGFQSEGPDAAEPAAFHEAHQPLGQLEGVR